MSQLRQYQADTLTRVQSFMTTHADVVGPLNSSDGRKQLDAAVTQLMSNTNDQGAATLALVGQAEQQTALVTQLVTNHLQPLATFSRAKLRGVPDFAALAPNTKGRNAQDLVTLARSLATAATPHADAMTSGGFPSTAIADLGTAADALETLLSTKSNTHNARVVATEGIVAQIALGREAIRQLHGAMQKQLAGNAALLEGWRVARRVVSKPGVARGSKAAAQPSTTPSTTAVTATPTATPATASTPITTAATPTGAETPKAA